MTIRTDFNTVEKSIAVGGIIPLKGTLLNTSDKTIASDLMLFQCLRWIVFLFIIYVYSSNVGTAAR